MSTPAPSTTASTPLMSLAWDDAAWTFNFSVSPTIIILLAALFFLLLFWRWRNGGFSFKDFEIDQAEFGVGTGKFRLKPNATDRQVAYSIWVELSTRKIGLPIDLENDVIAEIYDSWHTFFSVTRELVKSIPVTQVRRDSTQKIIQLSIEVLNNGLRPHLTRWQARYRAWYERELKRYETEKGIEVLDPQQLQATFPQFQELKSELLQVNEALVRYRTKMRQLVMKD